MDNENASDTDSENDDSTQTIISIMQEKEQFIQYINELENIGCVYDIEDMGNESSEQEYIMYIEDHCKELRELINKLYHTKLYIKKNIKNVNNDNDNDNHIEFYRDKLEADMAKNMKK